MENIYSFVRRLTTTMFERADSSKRTHIAGLVPQHARPPDEPRKRKTKPFSRDLIAREASSLPSPSPSPTRVGTPTPVAAASVADRLPGLP
ncbi:putative endonuclease and reverse transcriptase-like protein [Operophtera brumata]|uniref:Putative endonuclease and reverse transcriptase-like protein n=1 Tax=Operophtera brumata TaxID=104452 RepID=A0A0L7K4H3_OPEBR|nr:putative endonuclease and reverse transcriptase-like protein [Operophtera brumata]